MLINRNMRCIEIDTARDNRLGKYMINRNMRCIEIQVLDNPTAEIAKINRNMRCIEMVDVFPRTSRLRGLIET